MRMSHTLVLQCGCVVYVSCDPKTPVAHTRVVERRGPTCPIKNHVAGARLYLWEMLPERTPQAAGDTSDPIDTIEWC